MSSDLEARIARIAASWNAEEWAVEPSIDAAALQRADYFASFPDRAVPVTSTGPYFYNPAVCFHVYSRLQGKAIAAPLTVAVRGRCARNETPAADVLRLPEFTMREVVFFGAPREARAFQRRFARRSLTMAKRLGIEAELVVASDPFFVDVRSRAVLQTMKELKYELAARATGGGTMAIASFNLHEDFFATRFAITAAGGSSLHSACAAFGLERWTDAAAAAKTA